MVRMLFVALLFVSMSTHAEEGGFANEWWEKTYKPRIQTKQRMDIEQEELTHCRSQIRRYKERLELNPGSEYYKWKVEQWTKKCRRRGPLSPRDE